MTGSVTAPTTPHRRFLQHARAYTYTCANARATGLQRGGAIAPVLFFSDTLGNSSVCDTRARTRTHAQMRAQRGSRRGVRLPRNCGFPVLWATRPFAPYAEMRVRMHNCARGFSDLMTANLKSLRLSSRNSSGCSLGQSWLPAVLFQVILKPRWLPNWPKWP